MNERTACLNYRLSFISADHQLSSLWKHAVQIRRHQSDLKFIFWPNKQWPTLGSPGHVAQKQKQSDNTDGLIYSMWIQNPHNAPLTACFANTTNCTMWILLMLITQICTWVGEKKHWDKLTQGRSIYVCQWFSFFFLSRLFMSKGRGFYTPLFQIGRSICAAHATAAIRWATLYCIYVWL